MQASNMAREENKFLSGYSLEDYERPSIATDVAVFSLQTDWDVQWRNDPVHAISVLLIRRGEHPFKDCWALPGGFLKKGETVEDCMLRELREETGLEPANMLPVNVYSQPDRDPRGWIISHAFVGISTEAEARLVPSTDAAEARWFRVSLEPQADGSFALLLQNREIQFHVKLEKVAAPVGGERFRVLESDGLAFDHGAIIGDAVALLRKHAEDIQTVFAFLPEKFTLSALQKVQETLMGITHLAPNFRRKIAAYVEETEEYTEGAGHRPARLFKRRG